MNRTEALIALALLTLSAICAFLASGCTSTHIQYGGLKVDRTSFMQSVDCRAGMDINGNPYIIYSNDGGSETGGKVAGAAVKAIVR
jgi:hypothetical protein